MRADDRDPDFELAGFALWVHGWERQESADFWDANWLDITARYRSSFTTVTVSGTIILSLDIEVALAQITKLNETLSGCATFETTEPGFKLSLKAGSRGQLELVVEITPDVVDEKHEFQAEIDQSYLPAALVGLEGILARYSPRGDRPIPSGGSPSKA
jgi:hypothetical protein